MIRTLIVDDEPLARERIRGLLASEPDVELVGEARDGREAVSAIESARPDLVFLDVQMPEMDGFAVLEEVSSSLPLVVFVTAYDRYALQAFEVHALDYLLKPFDGRRFREALERARAYLAGRTIEDVNRRVLALLERLQARRATLNRFVVRSGGRIRFVRARDVDCIEATGNYMRLHVGGEAHLIRETMASLEAKLDPERFVRVHRSWIVNVERIAELQPWFHGSYLVVLPGGRRIHVSRTFRQRIEALLCHTA